MSQLIARLNTLYSNMLEIYNKFAEAMSATTESVTAFTVAEDGTVNSVSIPAIGYYAAQVRAVNSTIESLVYANDDEIALRFSDNSVKRFEMLPLSNTVSALESVSDMSFDVPADFRTKNNWFFESFLNPLMFVNVNVSALLLQADIRRFATKRVIVITNDEQQKSYFDQTIKGRSDIDYDMLVASLDAEGIPYHVDENVVDMPVSINRYRGSFTVVDIIQREVTLSDSRVTRMAYKLDTLAYYDVATGTPSVTYIAVGDTLVTSDDTEYEVISVTKADNTVVLERKFGIGYINIGVDQLKIRPVAYKLPYLQVNVGYDERQVIFVSPISDKLNLASDKWSRGFAIYTSELNVTLSDGTVLDMQTYYRNFVSDFGAIFMGFAKDRQVPSTLALTPNAPTLNSDNFSVLNINTHIREDKSVLDLRAKISAKEKLENQLDEVNKSIDRLKVKMNESTSLVDIEKQRIKKEIDQAILTKNNLLKQLSTLIQEITLNLKTQATFNTDAKYRVRGFWDMPAPRETERGSQSVIQFRISYRYLSKKGNSTDVEQLKFVGNTGQEKYGFFSNWNEQVTKIRRKEYDVTSGVYVWSDENVQDPDAVNINQVDIPINRGESVEIRVKSVSEAGYPINPAESEWSESVIIPFPDDLEMTEEDSLIAERMFLDDAVVKFQAELNARGLDSHLLNSMYSGDRYIAHRAEDISSGYYSDDGKIKDLSVVIRELKDSLSAMQQQMTSDYGVMKVVVTDPLGSSMEVKNGTTMQLFAGYYKDDITDSNNNLQHGTVVTRTYVLSISNTSATALELASRVIGGIGERAPYDVDPSNPDKYLAYPTWISGDTDYTRVRAYDKVPLVATSSSDHAVGSFKQESPQQTGQACGQFMYCRYRDYGLANELYFNDQLAFPYDGMWSVVGNPSMLNGNAPYSAVYDHTGKNFISGMTYNETPSNGYFYMPYRYPASPNSGPYGAQHPEIWDGYPNTSPGGNGPISEFCIHVDHPALKRVPSLTVTQFCLPTIDVANDVQSYVEMGHALHFNTTVDEKTDVFGAKYYQQCKYRNPSTYVQGAVAEHKNYPLKNGFATNDEYLIGKYTCGAYLFLAPGTLETLAVDGNHPKYAKRDIRTGTANSINVPIVFQYRCSDKLGYVGGYRKAGDLQNAKYVKKIGIDIYERDMTKKSVAMFGDIFSFDVEVSCQYTKNTNVITPIVVPANNLTQVSYSSTQ